MMRATIVRTLDGVRALAPEWGAMTPATPFAGWDFAHDWLCSVPDARPFVVVVESEGQLMGVAPWCLLGDRGGAMTLTGIGGESAWYHDPVLREPAAAPEVFRAVAEALRTKGWDTLDLILQQPASQPLVRELSRLGMSLAHPAPDRQSHVIAFEGDWEACWSRFPRSVRKGVARHAKRLEQTPHRFREVVPAEAETWLEELIRINRLRWQTGENWEPTYAFLRAHTPTLLARGELGFFALEIEGRLAVLDYFIRKGDRAFNLIGGFHPDFASYSPGKLLMRWTYERLHRDGIRAIDLGPGEYGWKEQVRTGVVETVRTRVGASLRGVALVGWRGVIRPRLVIS